jgi:Transposase, Mutator family
MAAWQSRPLDEVYPVIFIDAIQVKMLDGGGVTVEVGAAPPDVDGLRQLTTRLDRHDDSICAAIESMSGARFVHDRLELAGWRVEIGGWRSPTRRKQKD